MLRKFETLVENVIEEGHSRGVNLFMENLEEELSRSEIIESEGVEGFLKPIIEELDAVESEEVSENETNEDDEIDEQALDAMIAELEKEGLID